MINVLILNAERFLKLYPMLNAQPTITFLLTDLERSTQLWDRFPELMPAALERHDSLITRIAAEHNGKALKERGEGDSLFLVFDSAVDAAHATLAMQNALRAEAWPPETPIRVRMALHTGEASQRDGDYYGGAVNRCARIRTVGHGGQILLSEVTARSGARPSGKWRRIARYGDAPPQRPTAPGTSF